MSRVGDLLMLLTQHNLDQYTETLLNHNYSMDNFHLLVESDLVKLRVTNKNTRASLVGLAKMVREKKEAAEDERIAASLVSVVIEEASANVVTGSTTTATAVASEENPDNRGSSPNPAVPPDSAASSALVHHHHHHSRSPSPQHHHSSSLQRPSATAGGGGGDHHHHARSPSPQSRPRSSSRRPSTATQSTANECCREATIYLEHHSVDRDWPTPRSQLAQDLSLTNATPLPDQSNMYNVKVAPRKVFHPRAPQAKPGKHRWKETLKVTPLAAPVFYPNRPLASQTRNVTVNRNPEHTHGCSARYCQICIDHVNNGRGSNAPGHWEYAESKKISVGPNETHSVQVWKPFKISEMMKLDHALMRRDPGIQVRKKVVDFKEMRWGKKPVRRTRGGGMEFPTLDPRDLIGGLNGINGLGPTAEEQAAVDAMQQELFASQIEILMTEEETCRWRLWELEAEALEELRLGMKKKIDTMHRREKNKLAAAEERARLEIYEETFDLDRDELWELAGQLAAEERAERERLAEEARRKNRRPEKPATRNPGEGFERPTRPTSSFGELIGHQMLLLDALEERQRALIEKQEAAEAANLLTLGAKLHAQVAALLAVNKGRMLTPSDGLRCAKCLEKNCTFHKKPWKNHWRHRGGALDLKQGEVVGYGTVSSLLSHVNEVEFDEFVSGGTPRLGRFTGKSSYSA